MTNDTQPTKVNSSSDSDITVTQVQSVVEPAAPKKKKIGVGFWISLIVLLAALGLGGFTGYNEGITERMDAKSTLVAQQLGEQMALVQKDIDAKRYSVARQRLEFIIGQDAAFPGAAEKLAQVLVEQAITPSPVPTDTPTVTPTPDLRSQQAIYETARQQFDAKQWTALMGSLDNLRKTDPTYKAADVDGMYYVALRSRGIDQILGVGEFKITNMEGGIYDLTLAERFGPLDGYSDGLRTFSRLYIQGASYWDVNWASAVDVFRQVASMVPNMRDSSGVTASERLYQALLKRGDEVSSYPKKKDRCQALDIWNEAAGLSGLNAEYQGKFDALNVDCTPPTDVPTGPEDPTPTP